MATNFKIFKVTSIHNCNTLKTTKNYWVPIERYKKYKKILCLASDIPGAIPFHRRYCECTDIFNNITYGENYVFNKLVFNFIYDIEILDKIPDFQWKLYSGELLTVSEYQSIIRTPRQYYYYHHDELYIYELF